MSSDFGDLATREARHAEPKLEGNRWWPSEPERLVRILEEGGVMTSAERAIAERELAARERRSNTPPVLRREEVVFEPSSRKGLHIATIIGQHRGIIANPNCSTIQMVVALNPLHRVSPLRRVIVDTYQSVSGAGGKGIRELRTQVADLQAGRPATAEARWPFPPRRNTTTTISGRSAGA